MELPEVLEKIGLTEKESRVYLALLELGTASVQSIAGKAGIKRPTTYLILDELHQKGLVSIVPRAKKALFQAESPEVLISNLGRKEELIKRFLPNLQAIHNAKKEKPQVQLFEGQTGVKTVYDKILEAKEVCFFATVRDSINFYPEFNDDLKTKAKQGLIRVKEILTQNPVDVAFAKTVQHNEFYQHRFTSPSSEFLTDNVVFDNNVAFFSYQPNIFAVVVTSNGVSQSLRVLFEMAWKGAEPYEVVIKPLHNS
ncbi:MAG: hypothetical protein HY396_01900 [Candidatus Doudnabacteria bacterium]|nr:hypothetical protein [Candidatus Doudnabacteria bacterium]